MFYKTDIYNLMDLCEIKDDDNIFKTFNHNLNIQNDNYMNNIIEDIYGIDKKLNLNLTFKLDPLLYNIKYISLQLKDISNNPEITFMQKSKIEHNLKNLIIIYKNLYNLIT